jgi:hypothetical protein
MHKKIVTLNEKLAPVTKDNYNIGIVIVVQGEPLSKNICKKSATFEKG